MLLSARRSRFIEHQAQISVSCICINCRKFCFIELKISNDIECPIGIILTDALFSNEGYGSHIPVPVSLLEDNYSNNGGETGRTQPSSRRSLISWLSNLSPSDAKKTFSGNKPLAIQSIYRLVETQGIMFLEHTKYLMARILCRDCDTYFPDSIAFFLEVTRSLHGYIHRQKNLLKYNLEVASALGGTDLSEQIEDFDSLSRDLDDTLVALNEDVRFLVGEASIREGKIVGWVSKFAAVFLPVSLLAQVLSIGGDGFVRWAILGSLSVPFVLLSVYFMFFGTPAYFNSLEGRWGYRPTTDS